MLVNCDGQLRDIALGYLKDKLSQGNTLSRKILSELNFADGKIYLLMPFLPRNAVELNLDQSIYYQAQKSPNKHETDNSFDEFIAAINRCMLAVDNIVLLEDLIVESSDSFARDSHYPHLCYNQEVYWICRKQDLPMFDDIIYNVSLDWFFRGIVSPFNEIPCEGSLLTENDLVSIAEKARCVFHVAFDGEGFLVWERFQVRV